MNCKSLVTILLLLSTAYAVNYIDSCTNITASGVYELTADITGNQSNGRCIDIRASNVTLDCKGFVISGENITDTKGIISSVDVTNITIKGCRVRWYQYNIYTYYGSNYTIYNNSLNQTYGDNSGIGVYVYNTDYVNFSNNRMYDDDSRNFYGYYSTGTVINNNEFYDTTNGATTEYGVTFYGSSNTIVEHNYFFFHRYTALLYTGSNSFNVTIRNNVINRTNIYQGINLKQTKNAHVYNNTIINVGGYASYSDSGAIIPGINNSIIENNTIYWSGSPYKKTGIMITDDYEHSNLTIKNNNITNAKLGIRVYNTTNSVFENNNITSSVDGILVNQSSSSNNFTNNNINVTGKGLIVDFLSLNNLFQKNRIYNANSDIMIYNVTENVFKNITLNSFIVSLTGYNVKITHTPRPTSTPSGYRSLNKYFNITALGNNAWAEINTSYDESSLSSFGISNESNLTYLNYTGSAWKGINSVVVTDSNYVSYNFSDNNFSVGLFGEYEIIPIKVSAPGMGVTGAVVLFFISSLYLVIGLVRKKN